MAKDVEDELIKKDSLVYGISRGREGYAWKGSNSKVMMSISAKGNLGLWEHPKTII